MNLFKHLMLATFAFYIMTKYTDVYHHHLTENADKCILMMYSLYMYAFVYFSAMCVSIHGGIEKLDTHAVPLLT